MALWEKRFLDQLSKNSLKGSKVDKMLKPDPQNIKQASFTTGTQMF